LASPNQREIRRHRPIGFLLFARSRKKSVTTGSGGQSPDQKISSKREPPEKGGFQKPPNAWGSLGQEKDFLKLRDSRTKNPYVLLKPESAHLGISGGLARARAKGAWRKKNHHIRGKSQESSRCISSSTEPHDGKSTKTGHNYFGHGGSWGGKGRVEIDSPKYMPQRKRHVQERFFGIVRIRRKKYGGISRNH